MEDMQTMVRRLEETTRARRAALASRPAGAPAPAPVPGLKYQPGENVLDLSSGKRGIVVAGIRDEPSGRQVYTVDLRDGQTVIRTISELGADTFPIAPGRR